MHQTYRYYKFFAGEDGIINVWKRGEEEQKQKSAIKSGMVEVPSKTSTGSRKKSNKPYAK